MESSRSVNDTDADARSSGECVSYPPLAMCARLGCMRACLSLAPIPSMCVRLSSVSFGLLSTLLLMYPRAAHRIECLYRDDAPGDGAPYRRRSARCVRCAVAPRMEHRHSSLTV
jgi:hypothetical protein